MIPNKQKKGRNKGRRGGGRRSNPSNTAGGARRPAPLTGSRTNPVMVVRNMPLFGLRTRKRVPYFETVTMTGSISAVAAYLFSTNGCFDPNVTGTGHQPNGFDEVMKFYNHYTVLTSRVRVMFTNRGANACHVGLSVSGSTSVSTDYTVNIENGQLVFAQMNPVGIDGSMCTLKTSCNSGAFQGLQNTMDDPDMRGDTASNPAEQQYYVLTVWDAATAVAPSVLADVFIEYDVVFHEPKKAALD